MDEIRKAALLSQIRKIDSSVAGVKHQAVDPKGQSFDSVLDQTSLKISKHAEKRLNARQIELNDAVKTRLDSAIGSLEQKGARDSLVLMGDLAFVVNVPTKTVVTAITKEQMKEHVFTNIDSTMLIN